MKPFDLKAALDGAPVITRDGHPVTQLTHFSNIESSYVLYVVANNDVLAFTDNGTFYDDGDASPHDLFMAPVRKTVWVNLYAGGVANYHETQALADKHASTSRLGGHAWPLEIEE